LEAFGKKPVGFFATDSVVFSTSFDRMNWRNAFMMKIFKMIVKHGVALSILPAFVGCEQATEADDSEAASLENAASLCSDGEDNDNDGASDCDDAECASFCFEATSTLCSDGEDNNNDGAADCDDEECFPFCSPVYEFPEWHEGESPTEIGTLIAENFVPDSLGSGEMHYSQACTWYGALTLAKLADDQDLLDALVTRFDPLLTEDGAVYIPSRAHVDDRVFGIVPLEIYLDNEDERCLEMGQGLADAQWENPTSDGITSEARYWIDDMYMITAIQVQAFRATGDTVYRDRAALTMASYLESLQEDSGLFFHTANSPVYWGRGNGWVAAGMTEMLMSMSEGDEYYEEIMDGYTKMMDALLTYQSEEGIWRQIIDDEEAWLETSGSAMFTFAFVTGVKNGWLDGDTFGPSARKAWLELVENHLADNGDLNDVCVGTGEAYGQVGSDPEAQRQYYLDRPTNSGDYHGQAPMLWTASALLRLGKLVN
jgi:rhamnogalacturonyl hydrolase YesR